MKGKIHSFETFGTKDGPGIRFVLFMQGCPLQCLYCHNPDTWLPNQQKYEMSADEVFREIEKVKTFVRGGVTVSGGDPLLQPEFILELFKICKKHNVHTAIDTSGALFNEKVREVLEYTDLVLLDIKHIDPLKYKQLTSSSLNPTLKFMDYLSSINKNTWLRYVLVPQYTDDEKDLRKWAQYASQFSNVERIDILPFHQMAIHKWEQLGKEYMLKDVPPASHEDVQRAESIFREYGLNI